VSQALWAGGLHQTSYWNSYNGRKGGKNPIPQPATVTAMAAPELVRYVQERFDVEVKDLDFAGNSAPLAQPGDIIAYQWNKRDKQPFEPDHLAFVVSIADGNYPEVAEWGTAPLRIPYQKRGWTWSELNGTWLQADNPKMVAKLLHFRNP